MKFAPHVPSEWTSFAVDNIHVGAVALDFQYGSPDEITLQTRRSGTGDCRIEFAPALSLRADVLGAELNGRPVPFQVEKNSEDQHVRVRFAVYGGPNVLRIRLRNDFGLSANSTLPPLGARSRGLRVISESWSAARDVLTLDVSGATGGQYDLNVWDQQQILSVDGAELVRGNKGGKKLRIHLDTNAGQQSYPHEKITIHFSGTRTGTAAADE